MKMRFFFVDDKTRILQGLQRTLRNMQRDWEMSFDGTGEESLTALSQKPFP
jgi:hypothetical protein